MLMPPLRMGQCEPIHEPREIPILSRPDHEMPVIRHDTVGQESHRVNKPSTPTTPLPERVITPFLWYEQSALRLPT
jgi:hypothetical protein